MFFSQGCLLPSADIYKQMNDVCGEGKPKKIQVPSSPQLRPAGDQKVFAVGKGVMSFDFSKTENLLVTGGMDKLLRMWNPYMPEYVLNIFFIKWFLFLLH